jgi:hypothetical protein
MIAAPPRVPQLLLSALGARAEFRDAVLGDMAEEYYMRLEIQGKNAARAWYLDQACRAAPHLILDGVKNLGVGGIAHVVGAALKAYASIVLLGLALYPLVMLLPRDIMKPGAITTFALGLPITLLGGYLAARFGRRAPLLSSVALGAFWATVNAAALLFVLSRMPRLGMPTWYNFAVPAFLLAGTTLGGVFRIARRRLA